MNKLLTAAALVIALCTSCASEETFSRSYQAIEDLGYTNIQFVDRSWSGLECGEDDDFALKYTATSKTGREVELVACSGFYKGVTVRTLN